MASSARDSMDCPACNTPFSAEGEKVPLIAPCMHTICSACASGIISRAIPASLRCPVCNTEHHECNSVSLLPTNFLKIQTLTALEAVRCAEESDGQNCGLCENKALYKCTECPHGGEWLCEAHNTDHAKFKATMYFFFSFMIWLLLSP